MAGFQPITEEGIGAGIAKGLAAAGAAVAVNYVSSKVDADKVVSEISRDGGRAVAIRANATVPTQVRQLFAETLEHLGAGCSGE